MLSPTTVPPPKVLREFLPQGSTEPDGRAPSGKSRARALPTESSRTADARRTVGTRLRCRSGQRTARGRSRTDPLPSCGSRFISRGLRSHLNDRKKIENKVNGKIIKYLTPKTCRTEVAVFKHSSGEKAANPERSRVRPGGRRRRERRHLLGVSEQSVGCAGRCGRSDSSRSRSEAAGWQLMHQTPSMTLAEVLRGRGAFF